MPKRMRPLSVALVLCLSVVVALLAGVGVAPRTAHAAAVGILQVRGDTVFAVFESTDPTGCILTTVFVLGSELPPPQPGGPQQVPAVGVNISQFNVCTSTPLLAARGGSSILTFHEAPDLSTATLTASQVTVTDGLTGASFNVDITVMWDGTGSTVRQAGPSHFNTPGLVMNAVEVGFTRDATATGAITTGTTNFTPTPSSLAEVQNVRSGIITVTQG